MFKFFKRKIKLESVESHQETIIHLTWTEHKTITHTKLHININHKTAHVGIVEKCENEKVYTIEGNSNDDMCRQKEYDINSNVICGYGTPMY